MKKVRRNLRDWASLFAIWGFFLLLQPAAPGAVAEEKASKHPKRHAAEEFFKGTNIPLLKITIPNASMNELRTTQWRKGDRPSVKCTVHEGALTYTNVGVHLKGSAGSFQSVDEKPGLTLNMDKGAGGQAFHGLEKVSL